MKYNYNIYKMIKRTHYIQIVSQNVLIGAYEAIQMRPTVIAQSQNIKFPIFRENQFIPATTARQYGFFEVKNSADLLQLSSLWPRVN